MLVKIIEITGCRIDCPHTQCYQPNEDGETLGCSYAYGTLPKEGFAAWCPLKDGESQRDY